MGDEPALAIAVSARDWPDVLRQWLADHGGARVRLTALSARDVEEDHHHVLLIDDISSFLTRGLVAQEQGRGRRVIGVFDPKEPSGRELLQSLGVDAVLRSDEPADRFVTAARSLAVDLVDSRSAGPPRHSPTAPTLGSILEVRGVSGGVGVSELAVTLARALGSATVVELSPLPSIAQRLGLDLHPNIVTAAEMVDHGTGEPADAVQLVDGACGVVVGTADGTELGRGAGRRIVDRLRSACGWTVLDCGTGLSAPMPADQTVLVSVASPVGITRALDALRAADVFDTHLVLNRAPRGAFERAEVMQVVLEEIRPRSITIVPEDAAVTAAAWNGRPISTGPFVRAVQSLAFAIAVAT